MEEGYEFFAKRQLVTIFSAPNYCGEFENAGAMMSVDETLMCSFQVCGGEGGAVCVTWLLSCLVMLCWSTVLIVTLAGGGQHRTGIERQACIVGRQCRGVPGCRAGTWAAAVLRH